MNKFAKGSVAAGAGLVLLLGGAGTLAYWNDSAELANGSINAGTLTLEADNDLLAASIAEQPALWVPGDEHTFSTELTLVAEGDNISGDIQLDAENITLKGEGFDQFTFDMAMGEVTSTGEDGTVQYHETLGAEHDVITFDGPGVYTIPVEVTVELPYLENEQQNASMGSAITIDDLTFTATQSAPDAAA